MIARSRFTVFATLTALVLIAPAVIFFGYRLAHELEREFWQRSELMANNFADQVRFRLKVGAIHELPLREAEDLPQLQRELQEMTSSFVMGLILYAQIVWRGEILAEDIATSVLNVDLPKGELSQRLVMERRRNGLEYLDIWKALAPEHEDSYVRLGISLAFLRTAIGEALWPVVLWGLGLVGMIGVGAYMLWPRLGRLISPGPVLASVAPEETEMGKLLIDDQSKEIRLSGATISVTPREYALLYLLASEPGRVFSAQEIIERAWRDEKFVTMEDVKKYIYLLRQKLEDDPQRPQRIVTVRGFGYKLQMPN